MKGVEISLTCVQCGGTGLEPWCDLDCSHCAGAGSTLERVGADLEADLARAATPRELVARLCEAAECCESWADQHRRFKAHQTADCFAGEAAALRVVSQALARVLAPKPPPGPTSGIGKLFRRILGRAA